MIWSVPENDVLGMRSHRVLLKKKKKKKKKLRHTGKKKKKKKKKKITKRIPIVHMYTFSHWSDWDPIVLVKKGENSPGLLLIA